MCKKYFASCNKYRILHAQCDFHLLHRNYTSLDGLQKNFHTIGLIPKLKLKLNSSSVNFWKTSEVPQSAKKSQQLIISYFAKNELLYLLLFWRVPKQIMSLFKNKANTVKR